MVKQKVKRRGDQVTAMTTKSFAALFLIAALVIGVGGTALFQALKGNDDDDAGAKQTTDTGVNLTTEEIGSPWNTQPTNVAIDEKETVSEWMQTQAAPGDSPLIEPDTCNALLGAVPMFTGQANQAMLSMTTNDKFGAEDQSAVNDTSQAPQGTSMIQSTINYADTVSGSLAVDTIKNGLDDCVKNSSLSDVAKAELPEDAQDKIDYSFTENKEAAVGDSSAAYEIAAYGTDKSGTKKPLVYINVGVYYSEAHNTGTIIFIRSDSEKYNTGAKDMQSTLPKAAQKLEANGPQLGDKEVEE